MSVSLDEPIKPTCPFIDKCQGFIKSAIPFNTGDMTLDELQETVGTMSDQLNDCISFLEDMRTANDALRIWGNELVNEINKLHVYINELEDIIQ